MNRYYTIAADFAKCTTAENSAGKRRRLLSVGSVGSQIMEHHIAAP
jgi:hypothetical protein